jgi:poly(beta-D-mannuronate) lyase
MGLNSERKTLLAIAIGGILVAFLIQPSMVRTAYGADTVIPSIAITSPVNGATINGQASGATVSITGFASDSGGSGLQNVWVRADYDRYYPVVPKAAGDWSTWSAQLTITTPGTHTLTAKATDKEGNNNWFSLTITVNLSSSATNDIPAPLRTVSVNSIDTLMNAISAAKPGDRIVLKNGVYDNTNWLTSHSANNMLVRGIKGTATDPIVITPETIGGAEIKGKAGFRFYEVANLIIRGFKFTHSQDNAGYSDDAAIQCHLCDYVRFTRNEFTLTTATSRAAEWLSITSELSDHNRIDHNSFKNKSTKGVFLFIFGANGDMAKYNTVDHNYFYNQFYSAGNGGECMRIGNSERGLKTAFTTVEYNLFERCNGDMEAVTVKASNNTFRGNTFRDNVGSLTFRHGNNNVADGNYFLNGQNGIRSYGHDHKIINNHFASLTGSGSLTPLVIGSGTIEEDLSYSNNAHSRSKNVLVAFNTFQNNQGTYMRIGEDFRTLPPQYITVAHNILVGSSGTLVYYDEGENMTWTKNILYGSASKGNMPTSGYTIVDPKLVLKSNNIYGLGSGSPAIDQASSTSYSVVKADIDGQTRSGMIDTGADEYSSGTVTNKPLVASNVGPSST